MKKNKISIYILCWLGLFGVSISGQSQTQLIIEGHLVQYDTTRLVLQDVQFINNGIYTPALGTVVITGDDSNEQSAIGGDSLSTFYNLKINKTSNGTQLQQNIWISNELQMTSGELDLNGDTITLDASNGTIIGESETSRIIGPTGGLIQKTVELDAPSNENPGNLGLSFSSSQNLGSTLIQRSHVAQQLNDTLSITRSFYVDPTNNEDLEATILFHYLDAELNGHDESELGAWRQDSAFWYNPTATFSDTIYNYVQVDSIDFFSHWTLAARAPQVSLRVLLAGPYDSSGGEMADDLRTSDLLSTTEPYTDLGYTHVASGGDERINASVLTRSGSDAIVDWVFVELRDSADISSVIATRSALLQRDGDVVDLDGRSNLSFPEISSTEAPFISIRHRNHIGIIAASPVDLSTLATLDFATDPNLAEGSSAAMLDFGDGNYGLISGDFDGDGQVQNTDSNALTGNLGASGYLPGDSNLDGQVQNTDLQIKLTPNLGRGAQFTY